MEFPSQEYWSGFPDRISNPGIKPRSSALQADSLLTEPLWKLPPTRGRAFLFPAAVLLPLRIEFSLNPAVDILRLGGGMQAENISPWISWASLVAQLVKNLLVMQETCVRFLGWEDPLEKEMATDSSILA